MNNYTFNIENSIENSSITKCPVCVLGIEVETQEQLNQQEISRTEISFKSDRAVESSKLNAASFDAKAADRSYILSAAGQGLQGAAKAFSSSDLNLSSTPKSGSIAGSGSTTGNIIKN